MSAKLKFYRLATKQGWSESVVMAFSRFGMTIVKSQDSYYHMNQVCKLIKKKKYVVHIIGISSNIGFTFEMQKSA
jgi:hypothetical protein